MKKLAVALAAALTIATATVAAPAAHACGGYGAYRNVRERAVGQAARVVREGGAVSLELRRARFAQSGAELAVRRFALVDDAQLRALEGRLAGRTGRAVTVSVEETAPGAGTWRVTGWRARTKQA